MARPNYSQEKRKKELDRKRKNEDKQQRKQLRTESTGEEVPEQKETASDDIS